MICKLSSNAESRRLKIRGLALIVIIGLVSAYLMLDEFVLARYEWRGREVFPLWLAAYDSTLFKDVNLGLASPGLDSLFSSITYVGSTAFWLIAAALLWFGNRRKEAALLAFAIVVGGMIFLPIKLSLMRYRPFQVIGEARVLDVVSGYSFPSGHAKNVFTSAVVIGNGRKSLRPLFWILALAVSFSRIYVGAHWPLDVLAGGVFGWAVGRLTLKHQIRICELVLPPLKALIGS